MLFLEPQRTPYDVQFSILGIPVRIHPLFWLIAILPMLNGRRFDTLLALLWVGCVFLSILIHELGHALTVRYFGGRPWITLYGFGGLAAYRPNEWTRAFDPTARDVLISLAGPAAGFSLAGITFLSLAALGVPVQVQGLDVELGDQIWQSNAYLAFFLTQLIFVNLVWNLLNLLPVIPLDGGQVLQSVLVRLGGIGGYAQAIMTSLFVAAAVAIFAAVRLQSAFLVILFAYLAFQSYQLWQSIRYRR